MTTKKPDEILPPGAVPVESVFQLPDFDRCAGIPEVATWRDPIPDAVPEKPAVKTEKKEG